MIAVLGSHLEVPILTWAGTSADLPHLLRLIKSLGVVAAGDTLTSRHRDLYQYAVQGVRLPIPKPPDHPLLQDSGGGSRNPS
jgi:hypothetical protein